MNAYMWNLWTCHRSTYLQTRNRDKCRTGVDTKGDERGRWEELGGSDGCVPTPTYKTDNYCVAQGTLLSSLSPPEWDGSPKGRGGVCTCACTCTPVADALCCTVDIVTWLSCLVTKLCLTLLWSCGLYLPGSCDHGIVQVRTLEWVAFPSQGIFPSHVSSLHLLSLLHWQADSLPPKNLCHLGSLSEYFTCILWACSF